MLSAESTAHHLVQSGIKHPSEEAACPRQLQLTGHLTSGESNIILEDLLFD